VPDRDEDLLKMMFVCCHPAIPLESALALRTLCGFPVPALSRALRLDEAAVEKRLRARQVLREEHVERENRNQVSSLSPWPAAIAQAGTWRSRARRRLLRFACRCFARAVAQHRERRSTSRTLAGRRCGKWPRNPKARF